jgi:hypothetical protein
MVTFLCCLNDEAELCLFSEVSLTCIIIAE